MRTFSAKGRTFDFMRWRKLCVAFSSTIVIGSLVLLFSGKARLGTDFVGGTELEVAFKSAVAPEEIRSAVVAAGFDSPEVVRVDDTRHAHHYLLRVHEVSTLSQETREAFERAMCFGQSGPECPETRRATEVRFSPGGDKVTVRFPETPDLAWVAERAAKVPGVRLRPGENNPLLQNARDHKVEVQLMSKGDQLLGGLKAGLGARAPDASLRTEWIGPRAGAQLRDSAVKSIAIALVFIMLYVAFRFDLRFAPGGVVSLFHDAIGAVGVLILLGKEINLTTVAALLTIIGYSVNDTVVIYDRVRENLGKLRGASFRHLINVSTSEMLGRTLLTNATVQMSILGIFVWGTGTLKDFALTLTIGMVLGTYSTIYVALPVTEWLDKVLFSRFGGPKGGAAPKKAERPAPGSEEGSTKTAPAAAG